MKLLVLLGAAVSGLLPLPPMATGRYIVPLNHMSEQASTLLQMPNHSPWMLSIFIRDEPYVWSNQLNWGTQNCHTLLSLTEDGNVTGTLRLGDYGASFAEDMPILAGSFATNIKQEFVNVKYALGLNLYLDDPEEWRNSILWSNEKPVSASVGIKNGEVNAGLVVGGGRWPQAIATASTDVDALQKGDISKIKYAGGLYSNSFQGLVMGDRKQLRYIVNPNIQKYGVENNGTKALASLGVIVQGDNSILSTWGGAISILGLAMNFQMHEDWKNVKEVTLMF